MSQEEKKANEAALDQYRLGWASGDTSIILGISNKNTFNLYRVTENDPVYPDRFPLFFDQFKKAAETASGKPYAMRFPNIIHREVDGTYYESADWVVDGYDRGSYWRCARNGTILWDMITSAPTAPTQEYNSTVKS